MAASDFSRSSQHFAMSTGAGAQSSDISHTWCPATPSYPQQQQQQQLQQQWRQEMNQTLPQHNYSPFLPPPSQYNNSPYGNPRTQFPPYPSYDGRHPLAMHYPQSTFSYPLHPPRLPPAIRSGRVEELLESPCPDMYRGGSANHGTYHTWPQGLPPSASSRCPAWRGPQPTAMTENAPNVSFDRGQSVQGSGGGGGFQPSYQTHSSHPRPLMSNQPPQLEQNQQLQPTRNGTIRHDGHAESRISRNPSTQVRRSDRSSSPRTSARRSFDRYSGDLTNSSTSSDAEEAAARSPPANRIRRAPREGRPRFYSQVHDPNVMIGRQIKDFKAGLDKYLLGQLPEVTCPTCDICAKDYSATSVQPSEEEEIAIMLPCGHVFGEFCIDQWFETCKTHKNKITCPMCRKQLIEPPPSPYTRGYFSIMSYPFTARNPRPFEDSMASDFQAAQYARV